MHTQSPLIDYAKIAAAVQPASLGAERQADAQAKAELNRILFAPFPPARRAAEQTKPMAPAAPSKLKPQ